MATDIKAIQCPKCGSTIKTELKPGDYRCDSCGTEYFLDNGNINTRQTSQPNAPVTANKKKRFPFWFWLTFLILMIGYVSHQAAHSSASPSTTAAPIDDNSWSYRDELLYLSSDGKPVELTSGVNRTYGSTPRNRDYIAFYDLRTRTQLNRMAMPDASTQGNEQTRFDVRRYPNGDIYIVENNKLLCLVPKGSYAATEVTKTLFAGQPDLVSGIAKITLLRQDEADAFELFTNDGKNFVYFPATNKLYTKKAYSDLRYAAWRHPGARSDLVEQTGFGFTQQYNLDNAGTGARLMTYRYKAPPDRPFSFYFDWLNASSDTTAELKRYGITSHADFTPGRIYFSQRVMYSDNDYVIISYRITPADDAKRLIQCLNIHTGAVVFTIPFDDKYAPGNCIRYAEGFVIEDDPTLTMISLSGAVTRYDHLMGQHQ